MIVIITLTIVKNKMLLGITLIVIIVIAIATRIVPMITVLTVIIANIFLPCLY